MSDFLNIHTAYSAMFEFLLQYYERTKSDDIGTLLGSMSLLNDGKPADAAIWHEWVQCVNNAKINKCDLSLEIKK
ncbi:MAG: hypothetical protein D3909_18805 [Candidatus Electrothrix sp. ATG1]|nr:hypothetical protein [Candidatus Electrothrix sp. ATG1]